MPFARLTLNRNDLPQETVERLAAAVTNLLAQDLRKIARITVVDIDLQPEGAVFIGAKPVTGVGGHLEVLLSAEINTDEEKATFIDHAYSALHDILGELAPIFYVAVREIPALDWGYNGIPQGARTEDFD
jgi:4-oxalocrotonate tautomerase